MGKLLFLALLPWLIAELFAFSNKEKIDADGSQQSLMRNFHFSETVWRAFFLVGIPALIFEDCRLVLLDVVYNAGVFLFWFNPRLNILRGLPPDYVSTNKKKPSSLDGLLQKFEQEKQSRVLYQLRHAALISGIAGFGWLVYLLSNGT